MNAKSDWTEERHFRIDAVRGSRKLLRAILRAQRHPRPRPQPKPEKPAKLSGTCRPHDGVARIQLAVAGYYGIHPQNLWADTRRRVFARPRQIVMYLAHERGISLPRIGAHFGRDHTTVLWACRAIPANDELAGDIAALREKLSGCAGEAA